MKTSFAKTFDDYTNDKESKDNVFDRDSYERKITDEYRLRKRNYRDIS